MCSVILNDKARDERHVKDLIKERLIAYEILDTKQIKDSLGETVPEISSKPYNYAKFIIFILMLILLLLFILDLEIKQIIYRETNGIEP
jgi:hypothetical protein